MWYGRCNQGVRINQKKAVAGKWGTGAGRYPPVVGQAAAAASHRQFSTVFLSELRTSFVLSIQHNACSSFEGVFINILAPFLQIEALFFIIGPTSHIQEGSGGACAKYSPALAADISATTLCSCMEVGSVGSSPHLDESRTVRHRRQQSNMLYSVPHHFPIHQSPWLKFGCMTVQKEYGGEGQGSRSGSLQTQASELMAPWHTTCKVGL